MAAPVKSTLRAEIENQIIAVLRASGRPMSAAAIYRNVDTAEDQSVVSRIIGHMREAGTLVRDDDIPVGAPGGMRGGTKGARPIASYRLPTAAERDEIEAAASEAADIATESAETPVKTAAPATGQGKSADILGAAAAAVVSAAAARRSDAAREEDPAGYFDTAASSANGDENASPWARMLADGAGEDHRWESDLLQACETSRASLLTIADQLLAGHPVWSAARAVDRALTRLADEYV